MQCPECKSTHIRKNGINKQGKQNHICVTCSRQFIDNYEKQKGYDERTKQECLAELNQFFEVPYRETLRCENRGLPV